MKVTGYKLQHAIREFSHLRDARSHQFSDSLLVFERDKKVGPQEVMQDFKFIEEKIAKLQVAQGQYNLNVLVTVFGARMPLSEAVKRVGGAGRMEKMWRSAATDSKKDRYSYNEGVRQKDTEYAQRAVPTEVALNLAKEAARFASALREAIQIGNAQEVELELHPLLFE